MLSVQIENSAEEFALYIVHTSGGECAKPRDRGAAGASGTARPACRRAERRRLLASAEKQKLRGSDYPLIARILQGPCEQISKVFLMEKDQVEEITYDVSSAPRLRGRKTAAGGTSPCWGCRNGFVLLAGETFFLRSKPQPRANAARPRFAVAEERSLRIFWRRRDCFAAAGERLFRAICWLPPTPALLCFLIRAQTRRF